MNQSGVRLPVFNFFHGSQEIVEDKSGDLTTQAMTSV
jgi:hypothetical protein